MTKKKTKRDKVQYPNLKPSMNTKKRQPYMDNHHYADRLPEEEKQYLNDFNGEYYGADFNGNSWDYDNIHTLKIDKETVDGIKGQIRHLKALRKKIYSKSPNTTTDDDRALCGHYTKQIEEMEEFLDKVHPRREIERNNYVRMCDIINHGRASNEFAIVSFDTLDDNILGDLDPEFYMQQLEEEDE
jgi:hypothetical protein